MAKKKKTKTRVKKENKFSRFMIYLMIAAMLFSGLYLVGRSPTVVDESPLPSMEAYDVKQIGNASIVTRVIDMKTDILAKLNTPLDFEIVRGVENTTLEGLGGITLEVGNPLFYTSPIGEYSAVGGRTYLFFRFTFDRVDDNRTDSIRKMLNSELGTNNYDLFRGCIGRLPVNISGPGSDRVYLLCEPDTELGDYLRIFLLEKRREGLFEGTIGFIEKKIDVGPIVQAEVVNITDILVQGVIESDFHPDRLYEINPVDMEFNPPKIHVNKTLENETLEEINSLPGVDALAEDNKTSISFNASHGNVTEILDRGDISYSLENGYLAFTVPENSDVSFIKNALNESGVSDINLRKVGFLSLPKEVIIEDRLVAIPNNDIFNALLEIDTEINDDINVSLNTLRYGDQVFVMGAEEI
jgi:hypothetical protein